MLQVWVGLVLCVCFQILGPDMHTFVNFIMLVAQLFSYCKKRGLGLMPVFHACHMEVHCITSLMAVLPVQAALRRQKSGAHAC